LLWLEAWLIESGELGASVESDELLVGSISRLFCPVVLSAFFDSALISFSTSPMLGGGKLGQPEEASGVGAGGSSANAGKKATVNTAKQLKATIRR